MRILDTTSYCGTVCLIILLFYKLLFKVIRLCQQHFIFFPTDTFCYVICVQLVLNLPLNSGVLLHHVHY